MTTAQESDRPEIAQPGQSTDRGWLMLGIRDTIPRTALFRGFGGPMPACLECGEELSDQRVRRRAKFCSLKCGNRRWSRIHHQRNPVTGLPTGTVGALAELRVAADLMTKRWHVFRALSQACPSDLMIVRGAAALRVQVRSAYRTISGQPRAWAGKSEHDVLAMHFPDGTIVYEPPLPDVG